jgi:acetaldehyde dehydrogenase/alcohol dehydrogenase
MHLLNIKTVASRQDHMEWYKNPPSIYFARGCTEDAISDCARECEDGKRLNRCLIVTDKMMVTLGYVKRVQEALEKNGFTVSTFDDILPDPDMATVRKGVKKCEEFKPDLMVCLGGGSPMDAGKFIRVKYEHPELSIDDAATRFLELRKRTVPFPMPGSKISKLVCIPTTSGTASEVTPFSVITDDEGMKHPIFSYRLTPDMAIIDSSFCDQLPKSLIALPGIDAITHATEAYVSVVSNEFTETHSLQALKLLFGNLEESYHEGTLEAREAVHHGATIAGLAFSNSFLGIDHSLSHKIGANFHLPHGLCCGIVLPHVIRYNASKSPVRMGIYPAYFHPKALERYAAIAKYIGLSGSTDEELMEALIGRLESLMKGMNIPTTLQQAGVPEEEFLEKLDDMALQAFDDQCTAANPRFPLVDELKVLLKQAYYGVGEATEDVAA